MRNLRYLLFRPATNISVVDGFRGLSMVMILLFHAYAIYIHTAPGISLPEMIEEGGYRWSWILNSDKSVDVFFVISGFLITNILLRQIDSLGTIRLGNFYVRRFFRLTPVYYFAILIYILIGGPHLENVWANFLYIHNFIDYDKQAMNWTWTLAIEEQFYLLWPLLLMGLCAKTQRPLLWMLVLIALSCVVNLLIILSDDWIRTAPQSLLASDPEFHAHHFSVLYDNLYTRYGALLCGCAGAYIQHYYRPQCTLFFSKSTGQLAGWFSLAVIVALMMVPMLSTDFDDYQWLNIFYQSTSRVVFSTALMVLILLSFEPGALSRGLLVLFGNRFWYPIAQLSYSMYLVHVLAVVAAASLVSGAITKHPELYDYTPMQAVWIVFGISLVLTILVAVFMYLVIERPLMNLRK